MKNKVTIPSTNNLTNLNVNNKLSTIAEEPYLTLQVSPKTLHLSKNAQKTVTDITKGSQNKAVDITKFDTMKYSPGTKIDQVKQEIEQKIITNGIQVETKYTTTYTNYVKSPKITIKNGYKEQEVDNNKFFFSHQQHTHDKELSLSGQVPDSDCEL
jgi:uncharacterized membrane protein